MRGEAVGVLERQPQIFDSALQYWNAFQRVSGQRDLGGMGSVGALRIEAVSHWLDENGITDLVERERFRYYIEELDSEYLSLLSNRQKREMDKIQGQNRVRSR